MELKIAAFKSRLSEHLRAVRRGNEIIIKDRETPIARVAPYEASADRFVVRPATGSLQDIAKLPGVRLKRLKPGDLEKAYREIKRDWHDKWTAGKSI